MKPTPAPKYMQPGTRSVAGSGVTIDALGMEQNRCPQFMPDGVELYPTGPSQVQYYNGAQPPPVGGAINVKVMSKPMGGE